MKLVLIHPGSFRMGSAEEEEGRRDDEGPQAQVTLSNPFYIAITETTDHQYQEVMGRSQSEWAKRYARPLNNYVPVDSVSWDEAVDFCRKLNSRDRLRRPGWEYRLPTEAEWEYACRAGTNSPFSYGEKLTVGKHGIYNIDPELGSNVRLANIDPTLGKIEKNRPYPVGWLAPTSSQRSSLKPHEANSWGLFDMHGNVNEWCADFYAPDYVNRPARDPRGPAVGELRVVRGGSWKDPADRCRAAARRGESPDGKFDDVGFRVVLAPIHPR